MTALISCPHRRRTFYRIPRACKGFTFLTTYQDSALWNLLLIDLSILVDNFNTGTRNDEDYSQDRRREVKSQDQTNMEIVNPLNSVVSK